LQNHDLSSWLIEFNLYGVILCQLSFGYYFILLLYAPFVLLTYIDRLPDELMDQLTEPRLCMDTECHAYFTYLCNFHSWCLPCDVDSASKLYFKHFQHIH